VCGQPPFACERLLEAHKQLIEARGERVDFDHPAVQTDPLLRPGSMASMRAASCDSGASARRATTRLENVTINPPSNATMTIASTNESRVARSSASLAPTTTMNGPAPIAHTRTSLRD